MSGESGQAAPAPGDEFAPRHGIARVQADPSDVGGFRDTHPADARARARRTDGKEGA